MADWEEVKRLASDFQKVQLSSTSQKLSERNCIEIISWLVNRKLVDLIFTSDGKEYITPSYLIQDIKSELYVNGGRVNFVELAKSIGVDLSHITTNINDVTRGQKDIHSVLGQLIDGSYITKIAGEINQKLIQQGQINISDLTIQYDLPAEFLQQYVLEKHLGKLIHGKQDRNDPRVFFTESFIAKSKAKIRGALAGLSRPTTVAAILSHIDISDKLFFSLFDQVSASGFLTSRLPGAQYIPNVYSRSQNEWVTSFYKQNRYLEFDALVRLGISDYKSYLKKQLSNEKTALLNSCIISESILDQIEADIDECISSKSYVDLQSNLPSIFNEKDIQIVMDTVLTNQKQKQVVVIDSFILSKSFTEALARNCDALLQEKAKQVVESGKYQEFQTDLQVVTTKGHKPEGADDTKADKREERRKKAAGGKSGGGTQGRETKTKSTKKRTYKVADDDDYDDVPEKKVTLTIITVDDIKNLIQNKLEEEGLDELLDPLANYLLPALNENGVEIAAKLFQTTVSDRTANRRQTHNDLQNKLNILLGDIRLFEKGAKLLPLDIQSQLYKYLLKTLCTDVLNEMLNYVAAEQGFNSVTDNFTHDQRLKFVNDLPAEYRSPFQAILKSLLGQGIEDFMNIVEDGLAACSMILKKIDKKKDRIVILNHKHSLVEQLDNTDDPALVLHLAVLVIFITATQNMVHASGRHVAAILAFLKQYLSAEQVIELTSYHDTVMLMLSSGAEAENAKEQLSEKMLLIKSIANDYKKSSVEKS